MKAIGASLAVFAATGFCQPAAPAFEVASIKFYAPRSEAPMLTGPIKPQISGNRVTFVASVQDLVVFAYNLLNEREVSNPSRLYELRVVYDIEAVAPGEGSPSMDQTRLMTQALLADRFQLKMHREIATVPVYDLVVEKNGSNLKPTAPDAQPSKQNDNAALPQDGNYNFQLEYIHQPVSALVRLLSMVRDRLVLDKTGLTGFYDFNLEFTADPFDDRFATAQAAAVQEQLGLRLEPAEEPVTMLVIESIHEPSEN
jgi:uncharacterized protein (TIGR03435 family)